MSEKLIATCRAFAQNESLRHHNVGEALNRAADRMEVLGALNAELLEALQNLSEAVDQFNGIQLCEGLAGHKQGEMIMARWAALRIIAKAMGAA